MTLASIAVIEKFMDALGKGEIGQVLDMFAYPVSFNLPGDSQVPWTGRRQSREEVAEFFGLLEEHLQVEEFVVDKTVGDETDVVVLGHLRDTVRKHGGTMKTHFAIHFTVEDDKIRHYHFHEDSYAVSDSFVNRRD